MDSLETDRLLLRPLALEDLEVLHSIIGQDPDMSWNGESRLIEGTLRTLEQRISHYAHYGFGVWAVILKATRTMVGQIGLQRVKRSNEVQLVSYVTKVWRRRGIAFEGGLGSLTYGFGALGLPRIVAYTDVRNIRPQGLLLKLRFRLEGEEEVRGYGVYRFGLLREDFAPRRCAYTVHRDVQSSYVPLSGGVWEDV